MHFFTALALVATVLTFASPVASRSSCTVKPSGNSSVDDAPAILAAFKECGHNGDVIFQNRTYYINSVMNTTGLANCNVELKGTLLWSTNTKYWLANSLAVPYQNQSTVWYFGGTNINFSGYGYGTLNGNGDAWVSCCGGVSNYPRRPMAITIWNTKNSVFSGLQFLRSQMWTMAILHSDNILLEDINVDNLNSAGSGSRNTDGADTLYSNNIRFNRWSVSNGDDGISVKANSTNIQISNSTFYKGLGISLGSIGQYNNTYEFIENVTATNIVCHDTLHAAYVKTWTGQAVGYPPNGGGGGIGFINNVKFSNFTVHGLRGNPFTISQCTTFSSAAGNCDSSLFKIQNMTFEDAVGTITIDPIASLQCSAAAPCGPITIEGMDLTLTNGTAGSGYTCSSVASVKGFNCTGATCGTPSPAGQC